MFLLTIQGRPCFVDHFCYLCFMFVKFSCLFVVALWSPAGKALTSWLSCVRCFIVILLLSYVLCPGSDVVLDCINFWYLPSFLLMLCPTASTIRNDLQENIRSISSLKEVLSININSIQDFQLAASQFRHQLILVRGFVVCKQLTRFYSASIAFDWLFIVYLDFCGCFMFGPCTVMQFIVIFHINCIVARWYDKRWLSHGMCLYQVLITLHFFNYVANNAEWTEKR